MRFGSVCSGIEAASVESVKPFQESAAKLPEGMRVKAATRDIAGERFGRLVAQHVVGKSKRNSLVWLCKCDCGQTVERSSAGLRKSKGVSSCGCYLKEVSKEWLASVEPWNKGKSYATKGEGEEYANKKAWSIAVRRVKGCACERCGWSAARCDVHHVIPRSAGGRNTVNNGVVLCPNCHRVEHETSPRGAA